MSLINYKIYQLSIITLVLSIKNITFKNAEIGSDGKNKIIYVKYLYFS